MTKTIVTLSGGILNRAAHLRDNRPAGADAKLMPLWRGHLAMRGEALCLLDVDEVDLPEGGEIFLGLLSDGVPVYARDIGSLSLVGDEVPAPWSQDGFEVETLPGMQFYDLRAVMTRLTPLEAELAATGRALFDWHRRHGFCANCGEKTVLGQSGWRRDCPACGAEHYPRTDPVVIMLVTRGNDVLLGRNANWPEGMYSLLAGFVEPGEPIEAAVRREVFEEAGVRVGKVDYVTSQPWPFPASLMLGCRAEAVSREITLDPAELEDARWVRREEMALALAGRHPEIAAARKGALAQVLLRKWVADDWE
ncbi:NADH pyrophosphatase [Celeribacter ethanolicus]|uniref:NAD(+) diphosphatase n=1 Tax=Celeribacter ethanolicus TaxID=1758178 RepID=A0A291GD71_9RHOB|nr:NAD(+) diphosphatase [Celeribacter ethanolicus]ATG47992.1 NADH pyrophosphatase [Celeribacter ethanolicus]